MGSASSSWWKIPRNSHRWVLHPFWSHNPGIEGHTVEGLTTWNSLNVAAGLTEVRRQSGPEQAAFR